MKRLLVSVFLSAVMIFSFVMPSSAWSVNTSGVLDGDGVVYYTTPRKVNISPWQIAVLRTGGTSRWPGMSAASSLLRR